MTNHLPCGSEVEIDIDVHAKKHDIMAALYEATSVPPEHQVIRLGGLDSIFMGDKRTNIKFSRCGCVDNVILATKGSFE